MSNGAYVLTEHLPQERSVRERNTMYWDNENTIVEKVVALVINDENVALYYLREHSSFFGVYNTT